VKLLRLEQRSGDLVFVPSGWFHQVKNIVDTISINHNWFNASNIQRVYFNLNTELDRVKTEISDCMDDPDWNNLCQKILREHFGLNHFQLVDLLSFILERRFQEKTKDNLEGKSMKDKEISIIYNLFSSLENVFRENGFTEDNYYFTKILDAQKSINLIL